MRDHDQLTRFEFKKMVSPEEIIGKFIFGENESFEAAVPVSYNRTLFAEKDGAIGGFKHTFREPHFPFFHLVRARDEGSDLRGVQLGEYLEQSQIGGEKKVPFLLLIRAFPKAISAG